MISFISVSLNIWRGLCESGCNIKMFNISTYYQHINISTYQHINISTYQHINISTYQHINISTYQHIINISTYQHINISTYQHINISTYQHINISTYQHINISTYQHINIVMTYGLEISVRCESVNCYLVKYFDIIFNKHAMFRVSFQRNVVVELK